MSDYETQGGKPIDLPTTTNSAVPSLGVRAGELRKEALEEVARYRKEIENAESELQSLRDRRIEAVRIAVSVGVNKQELADVSGVSAGTVSGWVREDDGKTEQPREDDVAGV